MTDTTPGVPSPCVDVCRMNPADAVCDGCMRTLDEIACWSSLPDAAKREILALLPARRAETKARRSAPP